METKPATIKGLFVNTHVKAVEKNLGDFGVKQVAKKCGFALPYGNWENVPVIQEVKVIDAALQLLSDTEVPIHKLEYEAGKFHFNNFMSTFFAKTIFAQFGTNFALMMRLAGKIASRVFKGVEVRSQQLEVKKVRITMYNMDYPLEHFVGFFEAWLSYMKLIGIARGKDLGNKTYEYIITWKEL